MEKFEKKATVKDIAREAGVSVATVSYILNNRIDQKISTETKKKVLQIANLLNYKPNHAAKSLVQGRNNIIGIAYTNSKNITRNSEIAQLVNCLITKLARVNYDVLFVKIPQDDNQFFAARNVDAIFAIDLSHKDFRNLAESYMVPIICIDMIIDDNLFYQVYTDYEELLTEAKNILQTEDFYLLMDSFSNLNFQNFVTKQIDNDHIISLEDIQNQDFSQKKIITIGAFLALTSYPYLKTENTLVIAEENTTDILQKSLSFINSDTNQKLEKAITLLLNSLDRKFENAHEYKIRHTTNQENNISNKETLQLL